MLRAENNEEMPDPIIDPTYTPQSESSKPIRPRKVHRLMFLLRGHCENISIRDPQKNIVFIKTLLSFAKYAMAAEIANSLLFCHRINRLMYMHSVSQLA